MKKYMHCMACKLAPLHILTVFVSESIYPCEIE